VVSGFLSSVVVLLVILRYLDELHKHYKETNELKNISVNNGLCYLFCKPYKFIDIILEAKFIIFLDWVF